MSKTLYQSIFILLASFTLLISFISSYNYFFDQSILCPQGKIFNCQQVSGKESPYSYFAGIPVSTFGVILALMSLLYFVFPFLNPNQTNYLKIPFFFLLITSNLINLGLAILSIYIYTQSNQVCLLCILFYISIFFLFLNFYLFEFRQKNTLRQDIKFFFSSLKNQKPIQKELLIYSTISLFFYFLFFFLSENILISQEAIKIYNSQKNRQFYTEKQFEQFYEKPQVQMSVSKKLPTIGNPSAPIHIVVFHDLQCYYCQKSFHPAESIVNQYQPLVKLTYINYPIFGQTDKSALNSFQLAQYSLAAHHFKKFKPFVSELFNDLRSRNVYINTQRIQYIFNKIKVNAPFEKIKKIASSYEQQVSEELSQVQEFFVKSRIPSQGTPTFVVNGRVVGKGFNKELLIEILKKEIFNIASQNITSKK